MSGLMLLFVFPPSPEGVCGVVPGPECAGVLVVPVLASSADALLPPDDFVF